MTEQLKGWLGNRADAPVTIEVTDDLAREFLASKYAAHPMLSNGLALWLASGDGRNVAWEPRDKANMAAFDDLYARVRRIEKEGSR